MDRVRVRPYIAVFEGGGKTIRSRLKQLQTRLVLTRGGLPIEDTIPELRVFALSGDRLCGIRNDVVCVAQMNGYVISLSTTDHVPLDP